MGKKMELSMYKLRENNFDGTTLSEGVRQFSERMQIWKINFVMNSTCL